MTKNSDFDHNNGDFILAKLIKSVKIRDFDQQILTNIFEIICILMAAKNYTSNFPGTPFGPDYCTSSNESLTETSNQIYFQCIFKIFQIFGRVGGIRMYHNILYFCKIEIGKNQF